MTDTTTDTADLTPAEQLAAAGVVLRQLGHMWWRRALADSPEDFAQDVAALALARLGKFAAFRGPFTLWLRLTAKTVALAARKRRLRLCRRGSFVRQSADPEARPVVELVADRCGDSPADVRDAATHAAAARDFRDAEAVRARVRRAVAGLRPKQRTAVQRRFGLHRADGKACETWREINPRVGPETNKEVVRRGLENLRVALAEFDPAGC